MPPDDRTRLQMEWMRGQYRDSSNLRARAALHERFGTRKACWYRWLFDHYTFPDEAVLLEVGCGPGTLWDRNRDRLSRGWGVVLTDLSPGMVAEARQRLQGLVPFSYAVADVQALPLGDAGVDAVVANQMLSHVPDLSAALRELRRVLKVSGTFYAGVSGRDHMREVTGLIHDFDPDLLRHDAAGGSFTLEGAEEDLSPWFTGLRTDRFQDTLLVTEATPLVSYVYSMSLPWVPGPARRKAFNHFVEDRLQRDRAIRISRIIGIVTARPR